MDILKRICDLKKKEIQIKKTNKKFNQRSTQVRNFFKNFKLNNEKNYNVITEIKKSSPSKGVICNNFRPELIAQEYERAGAKCISVLTETNFFGGSLNILKKVKNTVRIPILRKDFIIDEWQIYESFHNEADCILLIVAALNDNQLERFYTKAKELDMSVITEIHNQEELDRALKINVECIGINNRNLKTLDIDLNTFKRLSPQIPSKIIKICESGLTNSSQLRNFISYGANAFLIGESLMKSDNIYEETKKFIKK